MHCDDDTEDDDDDNNDDEVEVCMGVGNPTGIPFPRGFPWEWE